VQYNLIERLENLGYTKQEALRIYEKYLTDNTISDLLDYVLIKEIVQEGVA
jgi:Holliday junction resolvasome RuvABC DNA-binding subunit